MPDRDATTEPEDQPALPGLEPEKPKRKRGRPRKNPIEVRKDCPKCGSIRRQITHTVDKVGTPTVRVMVKGIKVPLVWTSTKYYRCLDCSQRYTGIEGKAPKAPKA